MAKYEKISEERKKLIQEFINQNNITTAKDVGISDTQLYKQAGNSIVVNVLERIFENLYHIIDIYTRKKSKIRIIANYKTIDYKNRKLYNAMNYN